MKLVRQPSGSNLCGQACVAMVCDIELEEAIELVGSRGKTVTKQLKEALTSQGVKTSERRVLGFPEEGSALLFWKSGNDLRHWTVWHKNKHYDPNAGVFRDTPRYLLNARVTSHLKIYG